jgi:hypothetical protein
VLDAGALAMATVERVEDAGTAEAPDASAPAGDAGATVAQVEVDAGARLAATPVDVEVKIDSNPSAELFLDGKSLGKTPWSGRLPPGKKVFRFENKPLLLNAWRSVVIGAEPVSETFTFEKGFVSIKAPEGASIFIDGVRVGAAPIKGEVPVYEGSHKISVTYGKAQWNEPFTLYRGQRISFTVELQ